MYTRSSITGVVDHVAQGACTHDPLLQVCQSRGTGSMYTQSSVAAVVDHVEQGACTHDPLLQCQSCGTGGITHDP
jgi:hypothetical protein